MNVPVSLQPYLSQLSTFRSATPAQAPLAGADDGLFSDMLQEQLAAGQRVITAEEIIADLDGSPEWTYTQGSAASRAGRTAEATGSGRAPSTAALLEKIDRVAQSIGVDNDLVREVVRAESNFNPSALSKAGAKGLMQLMDQTARAMNVRNVYNPDENLAGGTKYLKSLLDRYDGNVKVALAAYNAGPGRINRLGIDSDEELEEKYSQLPKETQRYVEKIMNRLQGSRTS
ncbi:lytic transglycosylase domain-containing protein [Brevibacillus sp. GCM10020057]|uniref:lytic transglycosylase domain-containing protein n=1 Tax=Brevibacillus sp. GCM10020057 TaxID=3317327 RepID=UPI0036277BC6